MKRARKGNVKRIFQFDGFSQHKFGDFKMFDRVGLTKSQKTQTIKAVFTAEMFYGYLPG
jgi:hypothetical protein